VRVILDHHDPSTHWVALARVIENNPDLPADLILRVRTDGVCLHSADGGKVGPEVKRARFGAGDVSNLDGKMAFLEWLHEHFSVTSSRATG
jgi:hypothetical protein